MKKNQEKTMGNISQFISGKLFSGRIINSSSNKFQHIHNYKFINDIEYEDYPQRNFFHPFSCGVTNIIEYRMKFVETLKGLYR